MSRNLSTRPVVCLSSKLLALPSADPAEEDGSRGMTSSIFAYSLDDRNYSGPSLQRLGINLQDYSSFNFEIRRQ